MRIELSRLKDIDRSAVIAIVALVVGVFGASWLVLETFKQENAVETLASEVGRKQLQVDVLPRQDNAAADAAEIDAQINRLFLPVGREGAIREQLARIAEENHLELQKVEYTAAVVDPASTNGDDPVLQSLGVSNYTLVTIDFRAEYEDVSRFIGAVEKMPQGVLVRSGDLRRDPPRVAGTIALRVYQKGS